MSAYSSFYVRPARGEQVEAAVEMERDATSIIHGVVTDSAGRPVDDALLLLFRTDETDALHLTAHAHTDGDGHFAFGNLEGEVLYRIKVFQNSTKIRELK